MPTYTFQLFDSIPQSELVRIGFRPNDFLERFHCRTCIQKTGAVTIATLAGLTYLREYKARYTHYPIVRASLILPQAGFRQKFHYVLPIACFSLAFWWAELAYNRCFMGVQGAPPIPDQIIAGK
mmetsp:Transcript_17389/g.31384  ORF Transcript_17389/g.31384 Transcript_17389/m.31384 type:complete len:124 (-) Transcript_17389:2119-2490(-)